MKNLYLAIPVLVVSMIFSGGAWSENVTVKSLRGDHVLSGASLSTTPKTTIDGDGKVNRQYAQQPPLIPHAIDDYTIDMDGNSCLGCHDWNSEVPGATKVGISHFINRQGKALTTISPNRYFCNQCHVPQTNATALIPNTFKAIGQE